MRLIILVMFLFTNFAFLYGIFHIDINMLYSQIKLDLNSGNIMTFASLMTSLAATINIILVIIFYKLGKKNSKLENLLTKKSYWYRDVILDSNIKKIEDYFFELSNIALSLENSTEDQYMESFLKIKTHSTALNNSFIDLIKVIDKEFGDRLEKSTIDFEDVFVDNAINILTDNMSEKKKAIKNLTVIITAEKASFYKLLYEYEFMDYSYKDKNSKKENVIQWLKEN